jgi:ATP-dependent helicase HrpB
VRRGTDSGRYLLANGRGAVLGGPAALARSEIVVAADLDAGEREARVHIAAPLDRRLLEEHFADRIVEHDEVCWDSRGAAVGARRTRRLDALILAEQPLRGRDAADTLPAMLEGIRELGLEALPWTEDLRQWRKRVALMRAQSANETERAEWPDVSDAALLATLESWLAPWLDGVSRREHLARIDLRAALHGLLDWSLHRRLDEATPTHVTVPSGSRIAIDYSTGAPRLSVRLQEIFGWKESPRVADGRVAVTLELLSPARRPVQVTRDLASFWARGYAEVRKELKGRYPKHYWPDDPYEAVATRRVRPPGNA